MIKNIINRVDIGKSIVKLSVVSVVAMSTVSCSSAVYTKLAGGGDDGIRVSSSSRATSKVKTDVVSQYEYIIDSLRGTDLIKSDTSIISSDNLPMVADVEGPNYYVPEFTSDDSARISLAEYKTIMLDDLVLKYDDLKSNFRFPLDSGYVSSPYGWRRNRMHAGVDIKAYRGDNIYAIFDGVVRMSKYYTAFGNVVVIRHFNGLETVYAHASKLKVKVNQTVKAGDVIALAGRTGRATGDHLHFEVRVNGQNIDPSLLLDVENLTMQEKNIYVTMREGRIFASNNDSNDVREAEIKAITSIKYHTVRSGDTLTRIAANNGTTVTNLCKLNKISSKSILRLGQRIRVR